MAQPRRAPADATRVSRFRVLANPAYRTWAAADLVSVCGSWMQTVALNWLVYTMTGSTAMLGLTLTLSSLGLLGVGFTARRRA